MILIEVSSRSISIVVASNTGGTATATAFAVRLNNSLSQKDHKM